MRILFIGDVFGKGGRRAVRKLLPALQAGRGIDLTVANVENLTSGRGLDAKRLGELWEAGVHAGTTGNHVWHVKEIYQFIGQEQRLVRPANFPDPCPGRGYTVIERPGFPPVAILNLLGRIFMAPIDCPFRKADAILSALDPRVKIILVDFHAEATSEKSALSWYLDGRVSAVVGTHTHVQTADERILPQGTAAISDLGMTGPHDSIIGMHKHEVIEHFIHRRPTTYKSAEKDLWLHGAIIEVGETGKASAIERVRMPLKEE